MERLRGGAKYTRSRRPVVLVYTEEHTTVTEALQREYFLKQLSREEKKQLISGFKTQTLIFQR